MRIELERGLRACGGTRCVGATGTLVSMGCCAQGAPPNPTQSAFNRGPPHNSVHQSQCKRSQSLEGVWTTLTLWIIMPTPIPMAGDWAGDGVRSIGGLPWGDTRNMGWAC
jgi:hypothetical protein